MGHWIIDGLLALYRRPSYLEIGLWQGRTFMTAPAARKVGVDPVPNFDWSTARRAQPHAELHEMTSDAYFGGPGASERFDVIFLDGLHTFEQTLRDLLNAAERLQPRGIIVVDDILPDGELAALPDSLEAFARRDAGEPWTGHWMGDVYRLAFFVETFMQGWRYRTTAEGLGQMIIWRGPRPGVPQRRMEDIAQLPFSALPEQMAVFRRTPFEQIRAEIATDLRLTAHVPWTVRRVVEGVKRRLPGGLAGR